MVNIITARTQIAVQRLLWYRECLRSHGACAAAIKTRIGVVARYRDRVHDSGLGHTGSRTNVVQEPGGGAWCLVEISVLVMTI